ncbi:MAG: AAA family ATPase [Thermotogales bacterium]|nr:AAA family ATPase [Thermotogales bacterium]
MYQKFYGFREKPFSLLPDSGFLYLSGKHRMALTLLEYGLMNQAGFTVISGAIGTGKTTLIRKILNDIDPSIKVGLISNTHQTFGELLQWIALAYDLPHQGRDKVQLYQDFMAFIIQEYAQGRRTVLIVDEAQNMPAETLEELRMLSNVNADKDQVLQIILVGQRELRETLQRPDLVQFAQRIGVDYHLEPLDAEETSDYIRFRCKTAGGKAELFSDQACQLLHKYSGGVPRLINLLCDTALVYGYAEQRDRVDATLVEEVAQEKLRGGLFPMKNARSDTTQQSTVLSADITPVAQARNPASIAPGSKTEKSARLRIAIAADSELLRLYLSRLLTRFGIEVVTTLPLTARDLHTLPAASIDVLLVELDDNLDHLDEALYEILEEWQQPVLFNDSLATEASLSQPDRLDYGRKLSQKLFSLVPHAPQSVA